MLTAGIGLLLYRRCTSFTLPASLRLHPRPDGHSIEEQCRCLKQYGEDQRTADPETAPSCICKRFRHQPQNQTCIQHPEEGAAPWRRLASLAPVTRWKHPDRDTDDDLGDPADHNHVPVKWQKTYTCRHTRQGDDQHKQHTPKEVEQAGCNKEATRRDHKRAGSGGPIRAPSLRKSNRLSTPKGVLQPTGTVYYFQDAHACANHPRTRPDSD